MIINLDENAQSKVKYAIDNDLDLGMFGSKIALDDNAKEELNKILSEQGNEPIELGKKYTLRTDISKEEIDMVAA